MAFAQSLLSARLGVVLRTCQIALLGPISRRSWEVVFGGPTLWCLVWWESMTIARWLGLIDLVSVTLDPTATLKLSIVHCSLVIRCHNPRLLHWHALPSSSRLRCPLCAWSKVVVGVDIEAGVHPPPLVTSGGALLLLYLPPSPTLFPPSLFLFRSCKSAFAYMT